MVPLWAALVIGLGAAFLSGLFGTLLTMGHERRAEFRTRQLTAAEDYLRVHMDCLDQLIVAREALETRSTTEDEEMESLFRSLSAAKLLVLREHFRVELLFGVTSRTYECAVDAHEGLNHVVEGLEEWRENAKIGGWHVTPHGWQVRLLPATEEWTEAVNRFAQVARADVLRSPVTHFARTLRVRLHLA